MKTRNVTIQFNVKVPYFIPRKHEWVMWYKTLKYKFNPFRCVDTGERLDFGATLVQWKGTNLPRVMIQVYVPLSRSAMAKRAKEFFASGGNADPDDDQLNVEVARCDCCNNTGRPTVGIGSGNFDFRLCLSWWNGFRICEECMINTIEKGELKSQSSVWLHGKVYYVNQRGALVKPKGQLTADHNIQYQPQSLSW